jgi:hypothetical protein
MGKILETKINRFDGGLTQNLRLADKTHSALAIRVDTSRTQSIRPYKDFELDAVTESGLDDFGIEKFLYTGSEFFGFGRVSSANNKPQLYKKVSDDPLAVWTTEINGTNASSGARDTDLFLYYKNQDTIYGGNTAGIWGYTVAGDTFTHNENTSVQPTGNGIVHSKDDKVYIPCGNVVASKDGAGGWNNDAFTGLPADFSGVSIAEYKNFALVAGNRGNKGIIYFWDRDSSVSTATELELFGDNTIKWVDSSGGVPVVCTTRVDATTGYSEVVFFAIVGFDAQEIISFNAGASGTATVLSDTQRYGTAIQFLMALTIDGELLVGIWSISRKTSGGFKLEFITPPRNDTAVTQGKLKGFFRFPGYHFIAYLNENDGNKYTIWRTDSQANYTGTTVFNTVINPGKEGGSEITRKLLGVTMTTAPLQTGEQVVLKYKKDGETSHTTIFTQKADDANDEDYLSIRHSAINIESTGANLPQSKELKLRMESTGGAEITGLYFKEEEIKDDLY